MMAQARVPVGAPTRTISTLPQTTVDRARGPLERSIRRFLTQPAGKFGLTLLGLATLVAIFAPLLAPHSPIHQYAGQEFQSPSAFFPLGSDQLGRDVLSRIIYGTRVSLLVGVVAVAIGTVIGGLGGLTAGYWGGAADAIIMRIADAIFSLPGILLGIGFAAAFGASSLNVGIAIGLASMPAFARISRAAVISERNKDYVQAGWALGATHVRIVFRHVLPNTVGALMVQVALAMGAAVLAEAALSFLGLGSQPPDPSWGTMLAESRQFLRQAPWLGVFPGIAVALLVFGLNSCSDALRDAFDPRGTNG